MGPVIITRLTVGDGSGLVAYDILQSDVPVFLESTEDTGIYKLVLREGQYQYLREPAGYGLLDVALAAGSTIRGEIVAAISDHAPKGAKTPNLLVVKIKATSCA